MISKSPAKWLTEYTFGSRRSHRWVSRFVSNTAGVFHFGKIETTVTALIIVGILLASAFGFILQSGQPIPNVEPVKNNPSVTPSDTSPSPTPKSTTSITEAIQQAVEIGQGSKKNVVDQSGFFQRTPVMDSAAWRQVATYAWSYYQPGVGVDSSTGIPAGSIGWNYCTDWDLGVYIEAVMAAQQLGLITENGEWGSSMRLEKVLTFLETRELNSTTKAPYWFYASNGTGYITQSDFEKADTGTLFVALNNLRSFNPSLTQRINDFVYNNVNGFNNRTDYSSAVSSLKSEANKSVNVYSYFAIAGFECFFSQLNGCSEKVLDNILSAPAVQVVVGSNVTLPKAKITCEPLLYGFFYLQPNEKLNNLLDQVYLAHVAKYQSTGQFVGFSEGNDLSDGFIYEWVVLPNGATWTITQSGSDAIANITKPIIYTRVAISFLAIYNSTFAKDTCVYLEKAMPQPDQGYCSGAQYSTVPNSGVYVRGVTGTTNGLILAAARYASSL